MEKAFETEYSVENALDVYKMTTVVNAVIARIRPSLGDKIGYDRNAFTDAVKWTTIENGTRQITTPTMAVPEHQPDPFQILCPR